MTPPEDEKMCGKPLMPPTAATPESLVPGLLAIIASVQSPSQSIDGVGNFYPNAFNVKHAADMVSVPALEEGKKLILQNDDVAFAVVIALERGFQADVEVVLACIEVGYSAHGHVLKRCGPLVQRLQKAVPGFPEYKGPPKLFLDLASLTRVCAFYSLVISRMMDDAYVYVGDAGGFDTWITILDDDEVVALQPFAWLCCKPLDIKKVRRVACIRSACTCMCISCTDCHAVSQMVPFASWSKSRQSMYTPELQFTMTYLSRSMVKWRDMRTAVDRVTNYQKSPLYKYHLASWGKASIDRKEIKASLTSAVALSTAEEMRSALEELIVKMDAM